MFSIIWESVPQFNVPDSAVNMTIKLYRLGNRIDIQYGHVTVSEGIAGISCGSCRTFRHRGPHRSPALRRQESAAGALAAAGQFRGLQRSQPLRSRPPDPAPPGLRALQRPTAAGANDTFAGAKPITLPFESATVPSLTKIEPIGGDVDYFRFHLEAGETVTAEVVRGCFDTVIGVFSPTGELLSFDDDGGVDLLSKISYTAPEAGNYAVAVSAYRDFAFVGVGEDGGRYVLRVTARSCPPPAEPGPANWLVNGSFETGDLTGWTSLDTGVPITPGASTTTAAPATSASTSPRPAASSRPTGSMARARCARSSTRTSRCPPVPPA